MRFKLHCIAIAACSVLVSVPVSSQGLPDALTAATRKAVDSNPEVQARWQAYLASDAERDAAQGGYRPRVDLLAGAGRERQRTPLGMIGPNNFGSTSVTLSQMLYDGGLTRSEVGRASYAKLVRYYELLDTAESTALETVRAYADVLRYRELVELAKTNYVLHRQLSEQISERSSGGVGRRVDAEQASGRLALAESNLTTELSNLHDVSARYLRIVGEAPSAQMGDMPEVLNLPGMPPNIQRALEATYLNNPAMNAAVENIEAVRAQVDARRAAYKPLVELRLRQGYDRNLDGSPGNFNDTSVQVVLSYNLYRGGADQSRELQALRNVDQALDLKEKVCRDTRQTTMISFNDVRRLREQLGYLDQHRLSTEKAREAYRQQFDIGQRTLLDLLDTQNEFFEANRAFVNARYNLAIAEARTMAGVGGLMTAMSVARTELPTPQDAGQSRQRDLTGICTVPGETLLVIDKDKLMAEAALPPRARPVPPAPKPAPEKVTFSTDAFFDFDKAVIKDEGKGKLAAFAAQVKATGREGEIIVAVGHTDDRGSEAYNQRLSLARAEAVKAYLAVQGLDARRIRAEGRGESEPVASNDTDDGRARNRRVEILFTR